MHISPLGGVLLILSAAYLLPSYVLADTVYKTTDNNGKITYSSSPPENYQQTKKINILPPSSEEAVKAAHQRHQQNLTADKTFNENRQKRSQQITENNRIKREKKEQLERYQKPEETKKKDPTMAFPDTAYLFCQAGPA